MKCDYNGWNDSSAQHISRMSVRIPLSAKLSLCRHQQRAIIIVIFYTLQFTATNEHFIMQIMQLFLYTLILNIQHGNYPITIFYAKLYYHCIKKALANIAFFASILNNLYKNLICQISSTNTQKYVQCLQKRLMSDTLFLFVLSKILI